MYTVNIILFIKYKYESRFNWARSQSFWDLIFFLLLTNFYKAHHNTVKPDSTKKKFKKTKNLLFRKTSNIWAISFFELTFFGTFFLNCPFEPFKMNSKALFDTSSLNIGTLTNKS